MGSEFGRNSTSRFGTSTETALQRIYQNKNKANWRVILTDNGSTLTPIILRDLRLKNGDKR